MTPTADIGALIAFDNDPAALLVLTIAWALLCLQAAGVLAPVGRGVRLVLLWPRMPGAPNVWTDEDGDEQQVRPWWLSTAIWILVSPAVVTGMAFGFALAALSAPAAFVAWAGLLAVRLVERIL